MPTPNYRLGYELGFASSVHRAHVSITEMLERGYFRLFTNHRTDLEYVLVQNIAKLEILPVGDLRRMIDMIPPAELNVRQFAVGVSEDPK